MPKLTDAQLAGIVKYQGGSTGSSFASSLANPDTDGPVMIAIALAESGGVTDRISGANADTWHSHDKGLWQINDHWHADLLKMYQWDNADDNFRMAVIIYSNAGNKFTPWSTWKNGAYAAFMPRAAIAWGKPDTSATQTNPVSNAANNTYSAVTSVADLISTLTKAATWVRVGMALGGLILLLIAIAPMLKGKLGDVGKVAELAAL